MSKSGRKTTFLPFDPAARSVQQRKPVPDEFVLDALAPVAPRTRPKFGCLAIYCLAIYVEEKIVLIFFILRDKRDRSADNGIWLATTREHHPSLRKDFPNMRSIQALGKKATGWQVLPSDTEDFEQAALRASEFVLAGDARMGKIAGAQWSKARRGATKKRSRKP
jgi:hypothetical protein